MIINTIAGILGYYFLLQVFCKKFPFLFIAFFQIIFATIWMHTSVFFIDSQESIYSIELTKMLSSENASTYRMIFFMFFLIPSFLIFSKRNIVYLKNIYNNYTPPNYTILRFDIIDIIKLLFSLGMILVFLDIISGPIPLFSGIPKGAYYVFYASSIVKNFYTYSPFISFILGAFFITKLRLENKADYSFLFLYLFMIFIFLLLGNKFSILLTISCYFMIPVSTIFLSNKKYLFEGINTEKIASILSITGIIAFSNAVYYYFFTKWSGIMALAILGNRVLIQQGQIFVSTYNRVVEESIFNSAMAIKRVFFEPIYSLDSNTSLHYLMYQDIGLETYTQVEMGSIFTSGMPEILLELFGPYLSLFVYFIFSTILCCLLFILYESILKGRYLTMFFGIFVYHSINMSIIGGKLTYFCCGSISSMYLLKISLFLMAYIFERFLLKKTNYFQLKN
jgi:hypothetical protein